jgi:uncharacterized membrane protein (UPF0127 family)
MPASPSASVLWNQTRRQVLAARLYSPRGFWGRGLGLLARPPLRPGEALWLNPCGSIHTWGMRYAIDVVFVDRDLQVLRVARGLRPWRIGWAPGGVRSAIEFPAGAARVEAGDRLKIMPLSG